MRSHEFFLMHCIFLPDFIVADFYPKRWWLSLGGYLNIKKCSCPFCLDDGSQRQRGPPTPTHHSLPACNQPALCPPPVLFPCRDSQQSPTSLSPTYLSGSVRPFFFCLSSLFPVNWNSPNRSHFCFYFSHCGPVTEEGPGGVRKMLITDERGVAHQGLWLANEDIMLCTTDGCVSLWKLSCWAITKLITKISCYHQLLWYLNCSSLSTYTQRWKLFFFSLSQKQLYGVHASGCVGDIWQPI